MTAKKARSYEARAIGSFGGWAALRVRDARRFSSCEKILNTSGNAGKFFKGGASKKTGKGGGGLKLYDTKQVARFLDITERRVRQLREEGIISEIRPGLYDLIDANHRYINYLRNRNPDSEERIDYNAERAKLVKAKRENEEYDLRLKRRELHTSEEIERVIETMLINFRSRLSSIPSKLAPILSKKKDTAEIASLIKYQIDEALTELSEFEGMEEAADDEYKAGNAGPVQKDI